MRKPLRLKIRQLVQILAALLLLSALGATVAQAQCPHSPDVLCGATCGPWIGDYYLCQISADISEFCIEILGSGGCIRGHNHCSCEDFTNW